MKDVVNNKAIFIKIISKKFYDLVNILNKTFAIDVPFFCYLSK